MIIPPLFQSNIGAGISLSPPPVPQALPVQERSAAMQASQLEQQAAQRRAEINQRTFDMGMNLTMFFTEAVSEARFSKGKRDLKVGETEIDPAQRRENIMSILDIADTGEYDQNGNKIYDSAAIAQSLNSLADLEIALQMTNYQDWETLMRLGVASLSEKISQSKGFVTRGRLQEWLNTNIDNMRAEYSLKAGAEYSRLTQQEFLDTFEQSINDGDIDAALEVLDSMVRFRFVSPEQESLMRNRVTQLTPIVRITNEMLTQIFTGTSDEEILAKMEDIAKLTENEGPVLVENKDNGQMEINRLTPAQFSQIQSTVINHLRERSRMEQEKNNAEIDAINVDLERKANNGTLRRDDVDSSDLLDLGGLNHHRYWISYMDNLDNEADRQTAQRSQMQQENTRLAIETTKAEYRENVSRSIFEGLISTNEELRNVIRELSEIEIDGVKLFGVTELYVDFFQDMEKLISNPSFNPVYGQVMEAFNDSLDRSLSGKRDEEYNRQLIQNDRDRNFMNEAVNRLTNAYRQGELDPSQLLEEMTKARDQILSFGDKTETFNMMLNGEEIEINTRRLTWQILTRPNETPTDFLMRNRNVFITADIAIQGGFSGTGTAEDAGARLQQLEEALQHFFSDQLSHYVEGFTPRTHVVQRDARNNPIILERISSIGANIEDQRLLRNFLVDLRTEEQAFRIVTDPNTGEERREEIPAQYRDYGLEFTLIPNRSLNRTELAVRNQRTNMYIPVTQLSEEVRLAIGVNNRYVPTTTSPQFTQQPETSIQTRQRHGLAAQGTSEPPMRSR